MSMYCNTKQIIIIIHHFFNRSINSFVAIVLNELMGLIVTVCGHSTLPIGNIKTRMADTPTTTLRIACLEPSATAICLELGLGDSIVGVTHECGPILDYYFGETTSNRPLVLTKCGLNVTSQADIHLAIQKTVATASCPIRTTTPLEDSIPSTYPLINERLQAANPTVIFTQDLCDVCAPTTADVKRCLWNDSPNQEISIVSLQPTDLHQVTDTFVTIADACGIPERGQTMRDDFLKRLKAIRHAVEISRSKNEPVPTLFILEWLDPVFDSGHWTCKSNDC